MEILIVIGVVLAGAFWIKNQYPESGVARGVDCLLAQGFAIVKKQEADADLASIETQESIISIASISPANSEVLVNTVDNAELGVKVSPLSEVPEDSVLRRHYFAALAAERDALAHPYPTDSVLRRHYESALGVLSTPSVAKAEPEILSIVEPVVATKIAAPEDHVLKRHFLTQLRAEVEAKFLPRPTDSTLLRHYESLIQAEVAARLQAAV